MHSNEAVRYREPPLFLSQSSNSCVIFFFYLATKASRSIDIYLGLLLIAVLIGKILVNWCSFARVHHRSKVGRRIGQYEYIVGRGNKNCVQRQRLQKLCAAGFRDAITLLSV